MNQWTNKRLIQTIIDVTGNEEVTLTQLHTSPCSLETSFCLLYPNIRYGIWRELKENIF